MVSQMTTFYIYNHSLTSFFLAIAGVLIIWDRMFGTFTPEKDKVIYGLVHPLGSFDPLWIQVSWFLKFKLI